MAKMQHTPGPWKLCGETTPGEFVTDRRIRTHDGSHIAHVGPCNIEANAKLIAAAPDLLAAARCALADLQGLLHDLDEGHPAFQTEAELVAAIAKATA